jgi:transposase
MNKLPDLIRLLLMRPRLTHRAIAASLQKSRRTVDRYDNEIRINGYTWEQLKDLTAKQLHAKFNRQWALSKVRPDFPAIDAALQKRGMTLYAVWSDYRARHKSKALGYAQYAALYRGHRKTRGLSMRRVHVPGQEVLVDFSGKRPVYTDRETGRQVPVELFVAVLGASNYVFATCVPSQSVPDWIDAHVKMVEFFGGTPACVVPDNLRSAVSKSGRDPVLQRTYEDWCRFYCTAGLPARAGRPRDKGAVEGAVLLVQRAMLPTLDQQTFFSLDELNVKVAELLHELNERPFQKRPGCRRELFERIEKAALQPLPPSRFVYGQWMARQVVPKDYHVAVLGHHYSVPHDLVGKRVEARVSPATVEIHCDGECVAEHARSQVRGGATTVRAHQPEAHRAEAERSPDGLVAWAAQIGPNLKRYMEYQFSRPNKFEGLPAGTVIRDLAKHHTAEQLEAGAKRALDLHLRSATDLRHQVKALNESPAAPAATHPKRGKRDDKRRKHAQPMTLPAKGRRSARGTGGEA